ncbi:MAG TPA: hypothetical protein VKH20_07840 [Solirubrobacterales bacterium]|nr:hypothetical protein [Solirubrobacterales bacterium]
MKTKHFIRDLIVGMAPAFLILILPTYLAGLLLPAPFNLVAWGIILVVGGLIFFRRDQVNSHLAHWRVSQEASPVQSHRVPR